MSRVSVSAMKRGCAATSSEKRLIKKCALHTLKAEGIEDSALLQSIPQITAGFEKSTSKTVQ